MLDEELDSFIELAEWWVKEVPPYYLSDFVDEALIIARDLKKLRQEIADARVDE